MIKPIYQRMIGIIMSLGIMTTVFVMSSQPAEQSSQTSGTVIKTVAQILTPGFEQLTETEQTDIVSHYQHFTRKAAHFSIYALLGFSLFVTAITFRRPSFKLRAAFTALFGLIYAASDELHQTFVPGRGGRVSDVLLDFTGVLTGIAIVILINKFFSGRRHRA